MTSPEQPKHLDLKKETALTVTWQNGEVSHYPIAYLRKMSPSAEMQALRSEMASNPLTVLPTQMANQDQPIHAVGAELCGQYAIRIRFSDGHHTGLFSWRYLREIDPKRSET